MAFFERLASLIAPHECLICQAEGSLLCRDCAARTVLVKHPTCYRCNRLTENGQTCRSCRSQTDLSGVIVAAYYDGVIKDVIHELKYEQARSAAEVLAEQLVPKIEVGRFDLITSVPADPSRRRARGYNQAELIAKAVSHKIGLPYLETILRVKPVHQIGAARTQRLQQVKGAFIPFRELFIKNARILVIDDVVTTGATLAECAHVLKAAGAKRVWGAAVAKH